MLSFYAALRSSGYSNPVVIDAEDTDVYIQAASISYDIPGIICVKKKRQFLFCRGMCTDGDIAKCLISFHVMTGCDARSSSLDLARAAKWKGQKKKSLMRLPPDDDSLTQHIKRANYLAYLQRHPDMKRHPSPIGHGWELVNGHCKPVRHTQPALPLSIPVPSLSQADFDSNSDSDSDSEAESDYEALDSLDESD